MCQGVKEVAVNGTVLRDGLWDHAMCRIERGVGREGGNEGREGTQKGDVVRRDGPLTYTTQFYINTVNLLVYPTDLQDH